MNKQLRAIREAFDRLRPHVRAEADDLAGAMAVALDQADQAAAEYDFDQADQADQAAPAATPAKKRGKR